MGVPQIIVIILWALGFGINLAKHGEPKNDNYSVVVSLINISITFLLLWWGGFFG